MQDSSPILSRPAAVDLSGQEYKVVKLTNTGVDLATSADYEIVLGTLARANAKSISEFVAGAFACDVSLRGPTSVHYAMLGATTANIGMGDKLVIDSTTPGTLVPGNSNPVAISWDTVAAAVPGAVINVKFL